jgi:hypothetical protein
VAEGNVGMTISAFAEEHRQMDDWLRVPVRRAYREQKRLEAGERQAAFDAEVAKVAYEQNCEPETARDIVRGRRRFEHRRAAR